MKIPHILCLRPCFQAALLLAYQPAICEQYPLSSVPKLRNATVQDADVIAKIIISAFSPLPSYQYLHQYATDFPQEHRQSMRAGIEHIMGDPQVKIKVAEISTRHGIGPIAAAWWTGQHVRIQEMLSLTQRNCLTNASNMTRIIDWMHKFGAAKRRYVDEVYGTEQVYLDTLGAHRHYQGHGAGTLLASSGIKRARADCLNATLIAEPTAETFYPRLGFKSVTNFSITSIDNDQSFRFNVMALTSQCP